MGFFEHIQYYILLFTIFGLWSYRQTTSKYKLLIRFYLAYVVFLEIGAFAYVISCSYKVILNSSLSKNVSNWMYIIITLTHLVIVFETFVKSKHEAQLIDKFVSVDQLFDKKLQIMIAYKRERKQIFRRFFIVIASIIYLKGALSAYLHYHNEIFTSWYPALFSIWIMTLRSIQVVFFVYLVRGRLELIDHELKSIRNPQMIRVNADRSRQNATILRIIILNRVKTLKKIYAKLFDACELINKTFGWSLLAIITQCFVDFTFNSYWSFLYLNDAAPEIVSLIICVSLLLPIAMLSSILSFYCHTCFQQVSFISVPFF